MDFSGITIDDLPPTPPGTDQCGFTQPTPSPAVTAQEFHIFHTVDRKVYARLICDLCRDPIESVYVMAFWMWLEKSAGDSTIINRTRVLACGVVNKLADETVLCLRCLTNNGEGGFVHEQELTQLPKLLRDPSAFTLRFLHANRGKAAGTLAKMLCAVTARALAYMARSAINGKALPPADDILMQHDERMDKRFGDALSRVFWDEVDMSNQEEEVDRTVFLHLTEGCRLTEDEIREFFTRICGVIIEKLSIREVLRRRRLAASAYMVVASKEVANGVDGVYVINGNRVRAKRYDVKKEHQFSVTIPPWDGHSVLERC